MASVDSVIIERNMGRVLSQSFREDGISGRARSDRLLMRGPSFGEGAAIKVRRCNRKARNIGREDRQRLRNSLGGILTAFDGLVNE